MNDTRLHALEERVDTLERALRRAERDINWLTALIFVVPFAVAVIAKLAL